MISPLKFLILSMIPYDISYYGPYLSHLKRLQVTLGGSYILHLARNRKEDEELQIQRMRCIIELRFGVLYNSVNLRNISPDAPTCLLFLFLSLRMNRHIIARKKGPSPSLWPIWLPTHVRKTRRLNLSSVRFFPSLMTRSPPSQGRFSELPPGV